MYLLSATVWGPSVNWWCWAVFSGEGLASCYTVHSNPLRKEAQTLILCVNRQALFQSAAVALVFFVDAVLPVRVVQMASSLCVVLSFSQCCWAWWSSPKCPEALMDSKVEWITTSLWWAYRLFCVAWPDLTQLTMYLIFKWPYSADLTQLTMHLIFKWPYSAVAFGSSDATPKSQLPLTFIKAGNTFVRYN